MSVSTGERHRAELALERYSSATVDELETLLWPPVADRIREGRLRAGLTDTEIANRIGVTVHTYYHLEWEDHEAFTVISLTELAELGHVLGVRPRVLLLGRDGEDFNRTVSFEDVSERVNQTIADTGMTADQLGDLMGWNITSLLGDPRSLGSFNVQALYEICKAIGIDWVAAIP